MANYKTDYQRYNDRMDKIWERYKMIEAEKLCDCNKNYGNKDLQGIHDIDCETRKDNVK